MEKQQDWFTPLGFVGVFQRTFAVYRNGFCDFMKINATILIPLGILRILVSKFLGPLIAEIDFDDPEWIFDKNIWTVLFVMTLVDGIGSMILCGAYPRLIGYIYVQQQPDWICSIKLAVKRLGSLILAYLIYLVAVFIGMLLLYVPGVIVMVSFLLFKEAIMIENCSAIASLGRSWTLTKGKRCFTFCVIAVLMICLIAINVLMGGVANVGFMLSTAGIILQTVMSIFFAPISGGIVTVMYFSFRVQEEGLTKSQLENELDKGTGVSVGEDPEYTEVSVSMV